MKQFDELDKREKQSKSRVEIKSHLTRKNIVIVCTIVKRVDTFFKEKYLRTVA